MKLGESRFAPQIGEHCRSPRCSARVIWCHTEGNKKQMLVDAEPVPYLPGQPYGTIRLADTGTATPLAVVCKPADLFGRHGTLHNSHFVTCPDAERFRKRGYER